MCVLPSPMNTDVSKLILRFIHCTYVIMTEIVPMHSIITSSFDTISDRNLKQYLRWFDLTEVSFNFNMTNSLSDTRLCTVYTVLHFRPERNLSGDIGNWVTHNTIRGRNYLAAERRLNLPFGINTTSGLNADHAKFGNICSVWLLLSSHIFPLIWLHDTKLRIHLSAVWAASFKQ